MKRKLQGTYTTISTVGEKVRAFVPTSLPPRPPIDWTPALRNKFDKAHLTLGQLNGVLTLLPDMSLFLTMYTRKEALLSSRIEGTQSSFSDLLSFEMGEKNMALDDVKEVINYGAALNYGLERLGEGMPLSLRLIREIHNVLMKTGRGNRQSPGEFRRSQNWVGGTRPGDATFVPPPHHELMTCMGDLEKFLHNKPATTPTLLKAALAHVQFETIHPFLDGNGRLGRLLITLLLCEEKVLEKPMLYLSLYFNTHRQEYYNLFNRVRFTGDWEAWLDFFAEAVIDTANEAIDTTRQLVALAKQDREKINSLGQVAGSVLRVYDVLLAHPIATSGFIAQKTTITPSTVNKSLRHLEKLTVVREITHRKRNRVFCYTHYIDIINKGTELPDG